MGGMLKKTVTLLVEPNYKDLTTLVKIHAAGSVIFFRAFTKFLQIFQKKMKISAPVIPVSLAEHLRILKHNVLHVLHLQ